VDADGEHRLVYDTLVYALGSTTDTDRVPGVAAHPLLRRPGRHPRGCGTGLPGSPRLPGRGLRRGADRHRDRRGDRRVGFAVPTLARDGRLEIDGRGRVLTGRRTRASEYRCVDVTTPAGEES
jgi:hypothetical protein